MSPAWPSAGSPAGRVPLTRGKHGRGVLAFHLRERRSLTASERDLVENMARQLSLAVHRAALFEAVRGALQSAHEANRAKDEFLAMLGHELRNPLSPMLMSVEVIRQRGPDARALGVLDRQIRHVVRLVDDLLDVSRFARGRMPLARRPMEIAEVVARAVELVGPRLDEAGHELTLDVPTDGLEVDVDPQRLAQAVGNLLVNAAKFTPRGGHVLVSADCSRDRVRVHVQDDGAGLDEALLGRVFEPFVQGEQTLDRAGAGLGLGLAIVQRVAEAHGGKARAFSPGLGQGSTFTIELPAAPRQPVASSPPETSVPPRSPPASCERIAAAGVRATAARGHDEPSGIYRRNSGRRVLVVDDNHDSAEMMTEVLRSEGHQVVAAHDGATALDLAVTFQPEVALIDIGLPGMTGYDLAPRLLERARGRPMRLVAVTGYGELADQLRARDAGFDLHVTKPPDIDQLAAIVAGAPRTAAVSARSAPEDDDSPAAAS
jgi:signal transduction histidine kinase/CheY-like chemotaxis protein